MDILHSKTIGQGKPLFILHGFLGMSDNWRTLGKIYAERGFEVHMIDLRNHGMSFHSDDFSYKLMCDDLVVYMEDKNVKKANILGHSMGGKVAMLFAVLFPKRTDKLIVGDISPKYYAPHHQTILKGLQALDLPLIETRSEAEKTLSEYVLDASTRQFLMKNLYRNASGKFSLKANIKVLIKNIDEIGIALPKGTSFEGETLFLKGSLSDYITQDDYQLIKEHFPKSLLETIPKAGHWLHAQAPESFMQKSIAFLED